jgi:hypothetical protein
VQPQICSEGQWLRDCSQGWCQAQRDARSSSNNCSGESFAQGHELLYCSLRCLLQSWTCDLSITQS